MRLILQLVAITQNSKTVVFVTLPVAETDGYTEICASFVSATDQHQAEVKRPDAGTMLERRL